MKKFLATSSVAKISEVAMSIISAFDKQPIADVKLNQLIDELRQKSAEMTTAIKRAKTLSNLSELDAVRDQQWIAIVHLVDGYTYSPFAPVRDAAKRFNAVIERYGAGLAYENYASESAHLESALEDFAATDLVAAQALLSGVPELVQQLRQAQTAFHDARVQFGQTQAEEDNFVAASTIKKEVVNIINNKIILYLSAMLILDAQTYERFAKTIEELN